MGFFERLSRHRPSSHQPATTPAQNTGALNSSIASGPQATRQANEVRTPAQGLDHSSSISSINSPPEGTRGLSPITFGAKQGSSTSAMAHGVDHGSSIASASQGAREVSSTTAGPSKENLITISAGTRVATTSSVLPLNSTTSGTFKSLTERSITAWKALAWVGEADEKEASFILQAGALRALRSIDDLSGSTQLFFFFQRRESFMNRGYFSKWDSCRLDDYILLPAASGFINKKDCFFVSHFWRTQEHPDPSGEDFRLVRGDLAGQAWKYVWVDWTCLPQTPRTEGQEKYFMKMLPRSPLVMRDCGFEWRYPKFQPRLWVLVEVAQFMLTSDSYDVTPDIKPFIDDVLKMKTKEPLLVIMDRGYKCSASRDFRLLLGWLELLVIISKLNRDVSYRRMVLDHVEMPAVASFTEYQHCLKINKATGIVTHKVAGYHFFPLWPLGENNLPHSLEFHFGPLPGDEIAAILNNPELRYAKLSLATNQRTLGIDHADTIVSASKLGDVYMTLERYGAAEETYRQVLNSLQKTLGRDHFDTADALEKLALATIKLGQFKEAEELRREVLAILQDKHGPDHPLALEAINKLGATLHMQRRLDESSKLFRQYLDGMSRYKKG
ncbi:hypothetical protein BX600DRAFT_442552 [Xylariales sp. PMI_506]|nr:hypothetical protein BX600DRAFT_442552 [Xylariales sp. PMI_506]